MKAEVELEVCEKYKRELSITTASLGEVYNLCPILILGVPASAHGPPLSPHIDESLIDETPLRKACLPGWKCSKMRVLWQKPKGLAARRQKFLFSEEMLMKTPLTSFPVKSAHLPCPSKCDNL